MFGKFMKVLMVGGLTLTMIPEQMITTFAAEDKPVNLALNKPAVASNHETAYWDADKAVDGILNREDEKRNQSRWGTNQLNGTTPAWLKVDLGEKKKFQSFVLAWERRNITGYRVQISDTGADDSWKDVYVKEKTNEVSDINENFRLPEPVEARYVRLFIDGYNGNHVAGGGGDWKSVSLYEFQIYENDIPRDIMPSENYNLEGTASANSAEGINPAQKAIDGDKATRWAAIMDNSIPTRTLDVELPAIQRIEAFSILWERTNITGYNIQVSEDGNTYKTVYTKPGDEDIKNVDEQITLKDAVWAKYIRLNVTGYNSGTLNNYANVSVAEFEAYAIDPYREPQEDSTAKEAAGYLKTQVPTFDEDGNLIMPTLIPEFTYTFNADYEQIIAADGTFYQPLTDTQVTGFYTVTKQSDQTSAESSEITITVPGKYSDAGTNAKPVVVPELAEWYGTEGNFAVSADSRIVVSNELDDTFLTVANELASDYEAVSGITLSVIRGDDPQDGDFYFTLDDGTHGLDEEGYLMDIQNVVTIQAEQKTGAYWATRSILQILKLNEDTMPKGITRDYPKYKVRGFMLDVARKPVSMETMNAMVKEMAYYKMNDFQIHLNDNLIMMEDYPDLETAIDQAYAGFRLESDIKKGGNNGLNQQDLTSKDLSFTKAGFRDFIEESEAVGVNIVPEFDAPGHSLPFIKVRPDLHLKKLVSNTGLPNRAGEQFDLSPEHYDDSVAFVKGLWDEYLKDDMFDESMTVNIGTDEYYGDKEAFRKFSDDMIEHVQASGRTVRMWGSLSSMGGSTPVRSDGVQMNIWNTGWANPTAMYAQGYDLINMQDGKLYMVPDAGYYNNYLNTKNLYENWAPNVMGSFTIPAGAEQMLGSAYAIWNDAIDTRANGISELDIYDRFVDAAPTLAAKNWGDGSDYSYEELRNTVAELGEAPTNNAYFKQTSTDGTYMEYEFNEGAETEDSSANDRDLDNAVNVDYEEEALALQGDTSYVETPIDKLAIGNTLAFDITLAEEPTPGDIIFEANTEGNEDYSHDIRIMDDGTLGFTRELYDYSFGYTLPVGKKVHIEITTDGKTTTLYADGDGYGAVGKYVDAKGILKKEDIANSGLLLPLQRIGSKTNAIQATLDNIEVKEGVYEDTTKLDSSTFNVTTDNQNGGTKNEGPIQLAFDKDPSTWWHTQYSPSKKELPATVTIELEEQTMIDRLTYLPRTSGRNGNILKYSLYYSETANGEWLPLVEHGLWKDSSLLKTARFAPVNALRLKFVAEEGVEGYASASEINIHKAASTNLTGLNEQISIAEALQKEMYTEPTWNQLVDILTDAKKLTQDNTQEEIDQATSAIKAAIEALVRTADVEAWKQELQTARQTYKQEDYTKKTWEVFDLVLKVCEAQANDLATLTNAMIKDGQAEIQEIIEQLVDLRPLKEAMQDAEDVYHETYYTPESWIAYQAKLQEANAILAKEDASTEEIQSAIILCQQAKESLVVKGELEDLKGAVEKAETITNEDGAYTAVSYQNLVSILKEARAYIDAIDQHTPELTAAMKNKVETAMQGLVDLREVKDLVASTETLVKEHYTVASWNHLQAAKEEAQAIIQTADASKEAVSKGAQTLQSAIDALVDLEELKETIASAEQVDVSMYTPTSVNNFQTAIQQANAILLKEDASKEEVARSITELLETKEALLKKADKGVLLKVLDIAKALQKEDYTVDSWKIFYEILAAADNIANDEDATQSSVDDITRSLKQAMENLKKVEDPSDPVVPDTPTDPEQPSKPDTLYNDDQSISVTGDFPSGATITTTLIQKEEVDKLKDRIVDPAYTANMEFIKVWDMQIVDAEGNPILTPMTIRIKLDEETLRKNLQLIYIAEDGTVVVMPHTIEGDELVFTTEHNSTYAIISYLDDTTVNTDDSATSDDLAGADTGMQDGIGMNSIVLLLAGTVLLTIANARRREKE